MTTTSAPNRTPAIIGFLLAGAVILGASFFVSMRSDTGYDDVPPVHIVAPVTGDTVTNPVTITFRTSGRLHLDPGMGWVAGDLHLHVIAGGVEIMPAAADIVPGDSVYTWNLPTLAAGTIPLYLTWAGRHHGNLRGEADTVRVHVAR